MAFWGVVRVAHIEVRVADAQLPNVQSILGSVDSRLGEKVLEKAQQQVADRYATEKAAAEGVYGEFSAQVDSAQALLTKAETLSKTYATERAAQSAAAISTTYLQKGYSSMLAQHTEQLGAMTEVLGAMNDLQSAYNKYKQIFVQAKMLMGR